MRMCAVSYRRYNMNKLFKSFVALMMVAVLGMGVAVPAMADECETTDTELEVVSTTEMETRADTQIGGMSGSCTIRKGSVLGTCYVPNVAKSIEAKVDGVSGIVVLRFTNVDTDDFRSITLVGGESHKLTYTSYMDKGNWKATVEMCQNNASDCSFDIKFFR